MLLIRDENIVAKGEIAYYEQFVLLPQCFQKLFAAEESKCLCMRERVKDHSLESTDPGFNTYPGKLTHKPKCHSCEVHNQVNC